MSEYENGLGLSDEEIKRMIADALETVTPEELYRAHSNTSITLK